MLFGGLVIWVDGSGWVRLMVGVAGGVESVVGAVVTGESGVGK